MEIQKDEVTELVSAKPGAKPRLPDPKVYPISHGLCEEIKHQI